jgi:AcrR family transcriptional regulator
MTDPAPTSRADQRRRTEQRILDAATRSFFDVGYERTTIRAVASAADVDAGLVMHYFGSKQALFRRVIDAAPVPEIDAAPGQAAEHILAGLAGRLAEEPVASLTILRSMLTNPEAAEAIGSAGQRYQANIAQAIPAEDAGLRAAVINAVLLGITVSRHLLKYDELADADPMQIIELLRPGLRSLAAGGDTTNNDDDNTTNNAKTEA